MLIPRDGDIATFPNGLTYYTDSNLHWSTIGGAGAVGLSNIEILEERYGGTGGENMERSYHGRFHRPDLTDEKIYGKFPTKQLVIAEGACYSQAAWIRKDIWERDMIGDALANYPAFDEHRMSKIESQWEDAAWEEWVASEVIKRLEKVFGEDIFQKLGEEFDLYCEFTDAMVAAQISWDCGANSAWVDVDRVIPYLMTVMQNTLAKESTK